MKKRYFEYDVFLSHNADDGSHVLRDQLVALGATAWHDGYADMTDRRVQTIIWSALGRSRYICVCIHDAFRDSAWVQIEYGTGLKIERAFGIPRVIVAKTGRNGVIPEGLKRCRHFDILADGIEPLARFLIAENARLSKEIPEESLNEDEKRRLEAVRKLRSLASSQSHFKLSAEESTRLRRERLMWLLKRPPEEAFRWILRDLLWELRGDGPYYAQNGITVLAGSEEMRALYIDIFERIAASPDHIRFYVGQGKELLTDDVFLDAIADLLNEGTAADRACRVFDTVHDVESRLAQEERGRDWLRADYWTMTLRTNRKFIDDIRAGIDRKQAQERRRRRISKGLRRSRPFWKFW
jgi:hypothetical protein